MLQAHADSKLLLRFQTFIFVQLIMELHANTGNEVGTAELYLL